MGIQKKKVKLFMVQKEHNGVLTTYCMYVYMHYLICKGKNLVFSCLLY